MANVSGETIGVVRVIGFVEVRRKWRRLAVTPVLGALIVPGAVVAPPAAASSLDRGAVDRFVDDYVQRHGLPGVAVAVVKDGEPVHETAASGGSPRIPMAIGSVSKSFTAFAVLQLVDAGKAGLDDPVVRHMPEFAVAGAYDSAITIRQLLSHTSGLSNPAIVPPAVSPKERVAQLRDLEPSSAPGTTYAYSNLNYQIAARLVEVLSGRPFAQYLGERIFSPLGMRDTYTMSTTKGDPGLRDGHVTAYGTAIPLREMTGMKAGSGGVISTAHDQALWLAMLQRGGVASDGTRLLSARLLEEAWARQPSAGTGGLGWQHTRTAEPPRIGHSGSQTRFSARADLVPSSGYGVVVLLNGYTPTLEHPFEINSGVIDITEGRTAAPGAPVPTIIDAVLGLLTVVVVALAVRGVPRARRWAGRRRGWPVWRYVLRLLPQLIVPAVALYVFAVLPQLEGNSATALDAFGLWPAGMVLLLTLAATGALLTAARVRHRLAGPVSGTEKR